MKGEVWNVAFLDDPASPLRWWDAFTRPGFRHCLAFRYDMPARRWIVVEPLNSRLSIVVLEDAAFDAFLSQTSGFMSHCLRMRADMREKTGPNRLIGWCSAIIGGLLGLDRIAITPYRLYNLMLANGAEPSFSEVCRHGRDLFSSQTPEA